MSRFHNEKGISELPIKITKYTSEFIAKVFKRYPTQWLSTTEIVHKVVEIERYPNKTDVYSITIAFSHALKRLHDKGIVEKRLGSTNKSMWKLKEIEA